jgi:sugar O-acyltransferase (sialic acid O-acetyltransferase NeuD family)
MKRKLIIFGSSDIAQIAKYYFEVESGYDPVCFTLDGAYIKEELFEGLPVVPFEELTSKYSTAEHSIFIALSYAQMNKLRAEKYLEAKAKGYQVASYISSRCSYLSQYKPGENSFIFEDNTIQPFVHIGNNVTLWSGNHIGHHSRIDDHNFISSHVVVSGHCHIESYCFLGVNSTIAHNVRLGSETLVGAGAVITKDTEFQSVYTPAKSIKLDKKSSQFKL